MKIRLICLSVLSFAFIACGEGPEQNFVRATDIDFECDLIQSSLCDSLAVGKTVYMGLSLDLDLDCEDVLYNLNPALFHASFDYSGQTLARDGGTFIWGVVTQWANSSGAKTLQFVEAEYKLCAFLDDNNNGQLDITETIADQLFNPSEAFTPVTSWTQL